MGRRGPGLVHLPWEPRPWLGLQGAAPVGVLAVRATMEVPKPVAQFRDTSWGWHHPLHRHKHTVKSDVSNMSTLVSCQFLLVVVMVVVVVVVVLLHAAVTKSSKSLNQWLQ